MRRGTTPTLKFELPFDGTGISKCNIAFEQSNSIVIEKSLSETPNDISIDGNTIYCYLSEIDTLAFSSLACDVNIQLRIELNGRKLASNIIHTSAERILKDGVL